MTKEARATRIVVMAFRSVFDAALIRNEFENAGINPNFIPLIWKLVPARPRPLPLSLSPHIYIHIYLKLLIFSTS